MTFSLRRDQPDQVTTVDVMDISQPQPNAAPANFKTGISLQLRQP
jgi:hypothetical protein